jgi:hypothetical protein
MIYYKDPVQLKELGRTVKEFVKQLRNDKELEDYQREVQYWTVDYPEALMTWEDEGGFVNEWYLKILYGEELG